MRVLGLDSGGTKTVCYLADDTGTVLSEARGPGAHLNSIGVAGVEAILRQVIGHVLEKRERDLSALCFGMAGVDRPEETALIRTLLSRIVTAGNVVIVNDALVALEAGAPGAPGIVLISGTGSIAYGRDGAGRAARAGGWGHVLADEGSGYWLGRQALRSVMRHADGRGAPTLLTDSLFKRYEVDRAQDLVRKVYASDLKPAAIASLASIVQAAAEADDAVALRIIEIGASELADAAISVGRRLDLSDCRIVLSGGIFRVVRRMREAVTAQIAARMPDAQVVPLEGEPAIGAVHLALRAARGENVVPSYVGDVC
jgi:N-acetylglucosamine kinase-like BadF-type ATPase